MRTLDTPRIHANSTVHTRPWAMVGIILLIISAVVLWAMALPMINPEQMNDFGLVSVLPVSAIAGLVLLLSIYCYTLRLNPLNEAVLYVQAVILIIALYGITMFVYRWPRIESVWKHVGITETITRTGNINRYIDAYFNWEGFFILSAFLTEAVGLESALELARWSPVFFNLLYLGPLLIILRTATSDTRLVWLSVWFFYLTNWVGQDYFSPQGLSYFLFLVILAIVLHWFKTSELKVPLSSTWGKRLRWKRGSEVSKPNQVGRVYQPSDALGRAGVLVIAVILFGVVVASHQLTPFATLAAISVLVLFNRVSVRGLPLLMAVILGTWISYMAIVFFSGHLGPMLRSIGDMGSSVDVNLTRRIQGSAAHLFIVRLRLIMTLAIWAMAFVGGLRRLWWGNWDLSLALLCVAFFPLLALQSYGGEMILRVYLFSLPFMAFFAAGLFFPAPEASASWLTTFLIGVVSIALLGGFMFTRYGNDRIDYFTDNEIAAITYMQEHAEPDSLFVAATWNLPWRYRNYEKHTYLSMTDETFAEDVDAFVQTMETTKQAHAYIILTRSQQAYTEMFGSWTPEAWRRFEDKLMATGKFRVIYQNDDAKLLQFEKSE